MIDALDPDRTKSKTHLTVEQLSRCTAVEDQILPNAAVHKGPIFSALMIMHSTLYICITNE